MTFVTYYFYTQVHWNAYRTEVFTNLFWHTVALKCSNEFHNLFFYLLAKELSELNQDLNQQSYMLCHAKQVLTIPCTPDASITTICSCLHQFSFQDIIFKCHRPSLVCQLYILSLLTSCKVPTQITNFVSYQNTNI